ncbi:hypothetical protein LNL84_06425 [Vibrio sp. ZSDZ34]|jgi:hypothetical protein|uniref:Uncharacterized protein n=1 Tax=Vibrio gelatinilyticus TaxID=2893468 RepID=A0A9X2AYB7_9VIBR|nr:hypothetical protein [Vibrio gelatinilyticus]MCJ2376467.1 hypothetical protein [Vibrio gelatinilyticus]
MRHIIEMQTVNLSSCELIYSFWSDGIVEKAITRNKRVVFYDARRHALKQDEETEDA